MKNPFQEIYNRLKMDSPEFPDSVSSLEMLNRQRLQALYLVSQQIITILDPDELFPRIKRKIIDLMNAERAVIILREGDNLRIRIAHNLDDQSEQNALNFSNSIVMQVMKDYKPLYSHNAIHDPSFSQYQTIQQLEILSFICVPIVVEKEVLGTIYVDNRHIANVFTEEDVEFLQAFANLLGIAIRNSLAYQRVEELNRSLEDKVAERTNSLRKTVEELQSTQSRLIQSEKMASLGRLIAGFMHEFNNPINFIYSNLPYLEQYVNQLLEALDEAVLQLPAAQKEKLEDEKDLRYVKKDLVKLIEGVREGARRSREIVEDLKNFSGAGGGAFQVINWNENMGIVSKIFQERLEQTIGIELEFNGEFFVEGVKAELNQALLNILKNAVDAGAQHIEIVSGAEGDWLRCDIADDGSGISPEEISKLFDPFYTTKSVGQGMGLGLSITYSTITHHKGRIEISSQIGQGTTFRIFLPLIT